MAQIHRLIPYEGEPILYGSSHGDEATLEHHYMTYSRQCEAMGLPFSLTGFRNWIDENTAFTYAGTGIYEFMTEVDEFRMPSSVS